MSKRAVVNALRKALSRGGVRPMTNYGERAPAALPRAARPARSAEQTDALPALRSHEGSWIVTSPRGDVRELYEEANARKALAAGWKVETAGTYLGRINKDIRSGAN